MAAHRPPEPLSHHIHTRHHKQGHKESKGQTKDDRPGQRLPEDCIVAAKINMRVEVGKEGDKVDVEPNGKWYKCKNGRHCCQEDWYDTGLARLYRRFACFHAAGAQFVGKFDNEDTILDDNTGETNDPETGHNAGDL